MTRYYAWVGTDDIIWGLGTSVKEAYKNALHWLKLEEVAGTAEEMTAAAYHKVYEDGYNGQSTPAGNGLERRKNSYTGKSKWYIKKMTMFDALFG